MHGPKTNTSTEIERQASDHHRTLSRLAARLLYTQEAEEQALAELDKIVAGIERQVRVKFMVSATLIGVSVLLTLVGLLVWGAAAIGGEDLGQGPANAILPFALIATAAAVYWRNFQYGLGLVLKKKPALYGKGRQSTLDTLEKFFDYLGRRTAPKAYFYDRQGIKHAVSRRHFFGRLRGLLLSEETSDRSLVMPPKGFWFSAQIYVEAEPEEIIRALKVKPQAGGRPKEYAYEAMLLTLIELPALSTIIPGEHGSETQVMNLIRARCDASDEHDTDIPVPEDTELRKFAKKIIAAIKINRAPPMS
jgi:hypothetical protein